MLILIIDFAVSAYNHTHIAFAHLTPTETGGAYVAHNNDSSISVSFNTSVTAIRDFCAKFEQDRVEQIEMKGTEASLHIAILS